MDSVSEKLNRLSLERNIPLAVTLELTHRCLLSCAHCYLPQTRGRALADPLSELNTMQWTEIISQLAEAGGLYLAFTGGEPLLRADLFELCAAARAFNFEVKIYSSGLGLDKQLADKAAYAGVSVFDLSVYGRPEAHDKITGLNGSFNRTINAAYLLMERGIKVRFKTPVTSLNCDELDWLNNMAMSHKAQIFFDPVIAPGNDGDRANQALRLTGLRLAAVLRWLHSHSKETGISSIVDEPGGLDFICGAGRNVVSVNPYGEVAPCLQLPLKTGNVRDKSFMEIWTQSPVLKELRTLSAKDLRECKKCEYLVSCNRCPGISLLESGDMLAPNKPACEIAVQTNSWQ